MEKNNQLIFEKSAIKFADKFKLQEDVLQKFNRTILQMDLLGVDYLKYEPADLFMLILSTIEKGVDLLKKDAYIVDLQTTVKSKNEKGQIIEKKVIKPTIWLNINFQKQQILKNPDVAKIATLRLDSDIEVSYDFETLEFTFEKKGKIVSEVPRYAAIILMKDKTRHVNVMQEDEILSRLPENFTDAQKSKYTGVFATDHCTKMVLRNLLKNVHIDERTAELSALENINYSIDVEDADFEDLTNQKILEKKPTKKTEKTEKKSETVPENIGLDINDFK